MKLVNITEGQQVGAAVVHVNSDIMNSSVYSAVVAHKKYLTSAH